jgi:hypothetical protein
VAALVERRPVSTLLCRWLCDPYQAALFQDDAATAKERDFKRSSAPSTRSVYTRKSDGKRAGVARTELEASKTELGSVQRELKDLEPRLSFSPKLPTSVLLSILGQLGKKAGERAACVKRE